jgi:hypothetical protein
MPGRTRITLAMTGVAVILSGCATVPPEREERDRAIMAAIQPCKERYPELFGRLGVGVTQDGVVRYWYHSHLVAQTYEMDQCISEARKDLKVGPFAPGRLAANARPANIPVGVSGRTVVVPVRVNGVSGLMLLRRASGLTYVGPAYAKRAGLEIVGASPSTHVRLEGQTVVMPFARARSVEVGDASVEALDIAVHEPRAGSAKIDGVLGGNFLGHFKVNVDPGSKRLTLEPIRQP